MQAVCYVSYTPGGLTWEVTTDFGTGLAINMCSSTAGTPNACMNMPGSISRRLANGVAADKLSSAALPVEAAPEVQPTTEDVKAKAHTAASTIAAPLQRAAPRALAPISLAEYAVVPSLAASTGLSWAAPALLPQSSVVTGCSLVASPVVAATTSTIAYIAASVSVTQPSAPWAGWFATAGAPYIPGLLFGVYSNTAGRPGSLLWSARFDWDAIVHVEPVRTAGAAFWRQYSTFRINISAANPPLEVVAGTTYWLAIAGSGERADAAGTDWDFQQSSSLHLPAGLVAHTAVVSPSVACSTSAFPTGSLSWSSVAASGLATGGPAINLCTSASTTSCTALQAFPGRALPPGAVAGDSPLLISSGINAGSSSTNAVQMPASYSLTGCALLAAPVKVLDSGAVSMIVFSVSGTSNTPPHGLMLGIYDDNNGMPGNEIWTAFIEPSALTMVDQPKAGLFALDDWRNQRTARLNVSK